MINNAYKKKGVFHMMALPYICFYIQEEKLIVDVIDISLASSPIHI
jgi:hypothetical protein